MPIAQYLIYLSVCQKWKTMEKSWDFMLIALEDSTFRMQDYDIKL